jgi:UDP-N-acetylmuramate dehydrogenase
MTKVIIDQLPEVRGRYTENAPLGQRGWFRCGGSVDVLFKPDDPDDLQDFLERCPADIPVHIFGALSNTIIRDGGLGGVVIRLGREFADIEANGNQLAVGSLALDANVAAFAADHGIGGLEFLTGIPGTIGGALRMNAGCYGTETKDVLVSCEAMDRQGKIHDLTPDQMGMTYRHVNVPEDYIFLSAVFEGNPEDPDIVNQRMEEIKDRREDSQPIREKTGGSTFANPSAQELSQAGLNSDMKVWQIIESVGGRGLKIGGAMMSEKHCNFMINTGNATASDLEALGEEIRKRVAEEHGLTLRWEIKRIGEKP